MTKKYKSDIEYKHCIAINPVSDDALVTEWDDIPGAIGEWHAIDALMVLADLSSESVRSCRSVACNAKDLDRLTQALDARGWDWSDEGSCTIRGMNDGSWDLV